MLANMTDTRQADGRLNMTQAADCVYSVIFHFCFVLDISITTGEVYAHQ